MTRPQLDPLPTWVSEPVYELLDAARDATPAPNDEDEDLWQRAERCEPVSTGYKGGRALAGAGMIAAHMLRAAARQAESEFEPYVLALAALSPSAIGSWDWDVRMHAGLALRATYKDWDGPLPADAYPTRYVADWLINAGRRPPSQTADELLACTMRLCEFVLDNYEDDAELLATGWYATHGPRLLKLLVAATEPRKPGPPPAGSTDALREAVRHIYTADIFDKVRLAEAASVTRVTLNAWTKDLTKPV